MSWQEHSWARRFPQALLNPNILPRNIPAKNNAMVFDAAQMPASSPITQLEMLGRLV
jgi:hypothetical protein